MSDRSFWPGVRGHVPKPCHGVPRCGVAGRTWIRKPDGGEATQPGTPLPYFLALASPTTWVPGGPHGKMRRWTAFLALGTNWGVGVGV